MSILITTYEGTHNHPLASAATAMASTTSAAASMLLSGSSTSSRLAALGQPTTSSTTTSVGLLGGLTYNLPNGTTLSQPNRSQQFYIQNNSHITSSPNTHPTITLDLTTSNPFATSFTNPHFNRFSSSTTYDPSQLFSSKSTSLNFSSIDNNNPQTASLSWTATNNPSNALGYRNMYPHSNNRNNHNLGSLTLASSTRYPQENIYQSFMQKPNISPLHINQQHQQPQLRPDHIAAATKAITADPSFQTALAAALTSIIGGTSGGGSVATNSNSEKMQVSSIENVNQKMKWVDQKGTNGCGSSYLSSTSSVSNAQTSGLMFLQPSSGASKSKSTSPCENKQDHNAS